VMRNGSTSSFLCENLRSNRFHSLVEEPDREDLPAMDPEALPQRLGYVYKQSNVDAVREEPTKWQQPPGGGPQNDSANAANTKPQRF